MSIKIIFCFVSATFGQIFDLCFTSCQDGGFVLLSKRYLWPDGSIQKCASPRSNIWSGLTTITGKGNNETLKTHTASTHGMVGVPVD